MCEYYWKICFEEFFIPVKKQFNIFSISIVFSILLRLKTTDPGELYDMEGNSNLWRFSKKWQLLKLSWASFSVPTRISFLHGQHLSSDRTFEENVIEWRSRKPHKPQFCFHVWLAYFTEVHVPSYIVSGHSRNMYALTDLFFCKCFLIAPLLTTIN